MTCTHDLSERETACADGMCPLCLAARLEKAELESVNSRVSEEIWEERYIQQYSEGEKIRARLAEAEALAKELRIRYHAAGRRPEECYEMSLIDAFLAADSADERNG